jgi:hypothetical protein
VPTTKQNNLFSLPCFLHAQAQHHLALLHQCVTRWSSPTLLKNSEYRLDIKDAQTSLENETLTQQEYIEILIIINCQMMKRCIDAIKQERKKISTLNTTLRQLHKTLIAKKKSFKNISLTFSNETITLLKTRCIKALNAEITCFSPQAMQLINRMIIYEAWSEKLTTKDTTGASFSEAIAAYTYCTYDKTTCLHAASKAINNTSRAQWLQNYYGTIHSPLTTQSLIKQLREDQRILLQDIAFREKMLSLDTPLWQHPFAFIFSNISKQPPFERAKQRISKLYKKTKKAKSSFLRDTQETGKEIAMEGSGLVGLAINYLAYAYSSRFFYSPLGATLFFSTLLTNSLMAQINAAAWIGNLARTTSNAIFILLKKYTPQALITVLETIGHRMPKADIIDLLQQQTKIRWCVQLAVQILLRPNTFILTTVLGHTISTLLDFLLQKILCKKIASPGTRQQIHTFLYILLHQASYQCAQSLEDKVRRYIMTRTSNTTCDNHLRKLSLDPNSKDPISQEMIRKAWRQKTQKAHPDHFAGQKDKEREAVIDQRELNLGYEYLQKLTFWNDSRPPRENCAAALNFASKQQ